jgi:hypothetical protein
MRKELRNNKLENNVKENNAEENLVSLQLRLATQHQS